MRRNSITRFTRAHSCAHQAYTSRMPTSTVDASRHKNARIAVRLAPDQDALIRDAAAASGQSLTEFVTSAAIERAQDALADRRVFRLDAQAWAEFSALLDRPARPVPELVKLLREAAPWDDTPVEHAR